MTKRNFSAFKCVLNLFLIVFLPLATKAQPVGLDFEFSLPPTEKTTEARNFEREVFRLINQLRIKNELEPLIWNDLAEQIARQHSADMAEFDFFSHMGRDGLRVDERAKALGLRDWTLIGENIAYNAGFSTPAERAVFGWMNSDGHRKNILRENWRETGVGVARASNGRFFFTQVFLRRK